MCEKNIEWVEVRGTRVPKKQLEDAQRELFGLVQETEKRFEITGLNSRKK